MSPLLYWIFIQRALLKDLNYHCYLRQPHRVSSNLRKREKFIQPPIGRVISFCPKNFLVCEMMVFVLTPPAVFLAFRINDFVISSLFFKNEISNYLLLWATHHYPAYGKQHHSIELQIKRFQTLLTISPF